MPRHTMLVLTNPMPGQEAEYNRWYSNEHVQDVLQIPAVVSAQRFRLRDGGGQWQYLALYELETDDPQSVIPEIRRRSGAGLFRASTSIDMQGLYSGVFEAITEKLEAE